MLNPTMLTGQSTEHLVPLYEHHRLQPEAATAFKALQYQAYQAGFNLQPASTFRDFSRQQTIWNEKFQGKRPVLDASSQPLDIHLLNEGERCLAILYWSALPGCSRHHWGSDLDIYDPDLLPPGKTLQLTPWEYLQDGYFHTLHQWLTHNMAQFGFYRPFNGPPQKVAIEPWHLSYRPLAQLAEHFLTEAIVKNAWQGQFIAGSSWLLENLTDVFTHFVMTE